MITTAPGVALLIFLKYLVPDMPFYLVGLVPTFVGVALIAFADLGRRNQG